MLAESSTHDHSINLAGLKLINFRNFANFQLSFDKKLVALIGSNGIGKTNILEAISLVAAGKGLRNADIEQLLKYDLAQKNSGWHVSLDFQQEQLNYKFATFKTTEHSKRNISINDEKITKQQELSKFCNVVWLTPLMDNLFVGEKKERRKFFDRIVFNIFPEHLQNLKRYEHYLRERSKILQQDNFQTSWLDITEAQIADLLSSIADSRVKALQYLNAELAENARQYPRAILNIEGEFEQAYLAGEAAKTIEELAKTKFKEARFIDAQKKQTTIGVHKSDLLATYDQKEMPAKLCSTGEQKSLLISIIVAEARLLKAYYNRPPLLLLDEISSHLDFKNFNFLLDNLRELGLQCFFTTNNPDLFEQKSDIQFIKL